jgi:hypothetical protein
MAAAVRPPQPPKDDSEYDRPRIREGLEFAERILRDPTRFSPIAEKAMRMYRDACVQALALSDEEDQAVFYFDRAMIQETKKQWMGIIRRYERTWYMMKAFHITRTESAQDQTLEDSLVKLRKFAFYACYGAILKIVRKERDTERIMPLIDEWQTLDKEFWIGINQRLKNEKEAYENFMRRQGSIKRRCCITSTNLQVEVALPTAIF